MVYVCLYKGIKQVLGQTARCVGMRRLDIEGSLYFYFGFVRNGPACPLDSPSDKGRRVFEFSPESVEVIVVEPCLFVSCDLMRRASDRAVEGCPRNAMDSGHDGGIHRLSAVPIIGVKAMKPRAQRYAGPADAGDQLDLGKDGLQRSRDFIDIAEAIADIDRVPQAFDKMKSGRKRRIPALALRCRLIERHPPDTKTHAGTRDAKGAAGFHRRLAVEDGDLALGRGDCLGSLRHSEADEVQSARE